MNLLLSVGIACVIAAIVGGGMKALGVELPTISSTRRQIMLGCFGIILILIAFAVGTDVPMPTKSESAQSQPSTTAPASPEPSKPIEKKDPPQNKYDFEIAPFPKASANNPPSRVAPSPNSPTTWVDPYTGLMWESNGERLAKDANLSCVWDILGEYDDWRLPTFEQLHDLFVRQDGNKFPIPLSLYLVWIESDKNSDNSHMAYNTLTNAPMSQATRGDVLCVRNPKAH